MKNSVKLSSIILASVLLTGCAVFEKINEANPLPEDYGKEARSMGKPFSTESERNSRIDPDRNLNGNMSFEEWHNNQY